jgi:hypothetical protein
MKRPVWSVYICPLGSKTAAKQWCVFMPAGKGMGLKSFWSSVATSGTINFVDRWFFRVWSRCPFAVAMERPDPSSASVETTNGSYSSYYGVRMGHSHPPQTEDNLRHCREAIRSLLAMICRSIVEMISSWDGCRPGHYWKGRATQRRWLFSSIGRCSALHSTQNSGRKNKTRASPGIISNRLN